MTHSDRGSQLAHPEQGPQILFFSGGTALRETSRCLKRYTHNSVHLVTPFDSGGSSAELRRCFAMPSIGDLRNRLVALADESMEGNAEIYRLFSHRFPAEGAATELRTQLEALAEGANPLTANLPGSFGELVREYLRSFGERVDAFGSVAPFDLCGASVGNLLLASAYLGNGRDLDSAVDLFSRGLNVRGSVRLVSEVDLQLLSTLADGSEVLGQHRLGARDGSGPTQRIESIRLVRGIDDPTPANAPLSEKNRQSIAAADLICYPMGSLFSSVIAPLLVDGVASSVRASGARKVFVPNTGVDPEQFGRSPLGAVEVLLQSLGASLDDPGGVLDLVLLDSSDSSYELSPDREQLRRTGLDVLELPLVREAGASRIDPQRLVEVLLSLA